MELRGHCMEHLDGLRKLLLQEPRGYPCQNANYVFPPTAAAPDALYSFVIAEQAQVYPSMSGHNTVCVATALLETGMVPMVEPTTRFKLEAPAGVIEIEAACAHGKATAVTFKNQPAFVEALGLVVDVPHFGRVNVDIAFGGMWYVVVDARSVGLELTPEHGKAIVRLGEMIKVATREQHPVDHPLYTYPGPDILVFRGPPSKRSGAHSRNCVVMSNGPLDFSKPETWTGMIDRSPCGSGTCAVMATMFERGELTVGDAFVHESILGTTFTGRVVDEASVAGRRAIVPTITGSAWITQHSQLIVHPDDPFPEGFTVGDIWVQ